MSHFSFARDRRSRICSCHSHRGAAVSRTTPSEIADKQLQRQRTPPRRWLERVLRGGRLAAHEDSFFETRQEQQDRYYSLLDEYHRLFKLVEEELSYATETQGSIYYEGDLAAAKNALEQWLDCYDALVSIMLDRSELEALVKGCERAKQTFYDKLKHLPLP
ncbi:hypothetical protein BX666DRAFT_1876674 [Dichotomocladium elegans]|nr:hypothetical protein BX666DRAFT_1876674 [Dichotomocladium elegans]